MFSNTCWIKICPKLNLVVCLPQGWTQVWTSHTSIPYRGPKVGELEELFPRVLFPAHCQCMCLQWTQPPLGPLWIGYMRINADNIFYLVYPSDQFLNLRITKALLTIGGISLVLKSLWSVLTYNILIYAPNDPGYSHYSHLKHEEPKV